MLSTAPSAWMLNHWKLIQCERVKEGDWKNTHCNFLWELGKQGVAENEASTSTGIYHSLWASLLWAKE